LYEYQVVRRFRGGRMIIHKYSTWASILQEEKVGDGMGRDSVESKMFRYLWSLNM